MQYLLGYSEAWLNISKYVKTLQIILKTFMDFISLNEFKSRIIRFSNELFVLINQQIRQLSVFWLTYRFFLFRFVAGAFIDLRR